jgi:hypothetical protein
VNWRHEVKFILDETAFHRLYFGLKPIMYQDRHAVPTEPAGFPAYRIRSLYFDDIGLKGVFDKLAGNNPRHKFRIRIYQGSHQYIRLEKKIKSGNMTQKRSCRLDREQTDRLLAGDWASLHDETLESLRKNPDRTRRQQLHLLLQFYAENRTQLLEPHLLVDYQRMPLIFPAGNVRITFDRFLSTGIYRKDLWDPGAALQPVFNDGRLIMEVKYDRFLPDFIRSAIRYPGLSPFAVSKYVQCAGICRQQSWEDQV